MKRTRRTSRKSTGEGWSLDTSDTPASGKAPAEGRQGPPLARLGLEKRRGKPVTVVALEGLDDSARRSLAKELKVRCGSGGTAKGGAVELQGDHRDALRGFLSEKGVQVKG